MNDQTTKLIEKLADKLGTTSQYLWSVLLKQAKFTACIDLVYIVLITIIGFIIYRLHLKFNRETNVSGKSNLSIYYEYEPTPQIFIVIVTVFWFIFFTIAFCNLGEVINGFFNPEYWALKEVIGAVS